MVAVNAPPGTGSPDSPTFSAEYARNARKLAEALISPAFSPENNSLSELWEVLTSSDATGLYSSSAQLNCTYSRCDFPLLVQLPNSATHAESSAQNAP
mmetsp:Transcript_50461/g.100414  ORF Transcript_50461/g.100414 Transcript_50461/m.100414 type:complete len:98 (+) Transcript_50461:874-1167(+)